MNPIIIVLPILAILMFELGLNLRLGDFNLILKRPLAVVVGLVGQLVLLPILAFLISSYFSLEPVFFVGVMLIACCPGGSSSNVFSLLAGGDVALSVLLTSLSSIITLFTIPIILSLTMNYVDFAGASQFNLPIGMLVAQNIIMMLVPIILGVMCMKFNPVFWARANKLLSKIAFPLLLLLAAIFFIQHHDVIIAQFTSLGLVLTALLLLSVTLSIVLSFIFRLNDKERKTIVFEVGMQNAASAIAIACSPFVFNNEIMAIPAIIYALVMNICLLSYLYFVKK